MKIWKSEMLALSRAGHDKDVCYVVLDEDDSYVWLADGRRRTLEKPKKKKKKHVQIIRHLPDELLGQMQTISENAHLRRIISDYRAMQNRKE